MRRGIFALHSDGKNKKTTWYDDNDESIREKAIKAICDIRRDAQSRPELSLEEINAEINAVREAKANKI